MGTYHDEYWISEGLGRNRKERMSGRYSYYLPTRLSKLTIALDPDVVGDVGRAERAIAELNSSARTLRSTEGIARLLLRAEAVSSSHIEGLTIGTRRLLRAELGLRGEQGVRFDGAAADIVGNIHAMEKALDTVQASDAVTVETLLSVHRSLCRNTRIESIGGMVRTTQNWVGGNSYNPLQAIYVPPAPEHLDDLLTDLAAYCNDETVSPVVQAALVHAQFENIHPFMDGNGRTGRALIHLVLRRRGLAPNLVPPISLVMATHAESYIEGLSLFAFDDSDAPENVHESLNEWVSLFAGFCIEACEEAGAFERSSTQLQEKWRARLAPVRKNSALDLLIGEMTSMPVFTIASACDSMGRSFHAVTEAVERCLEAGIVKQLGSQQRNRAFEVPEAITEFNIFERRLASPVGDTKKEKPARAVPENLSRRR